MPSTGKRRSIFGRSALSVLTPIHDGSVQENDSTTDLNLLKKRRTPSFLSGASSPARSDSFGLDGESLVMSPRNDLSLRSSGLSSQVFGSWRSQKSADDNDEPSTAVSLTPPSVNWEEIGESGIRGRRVIHHGEIQTGSAVFRKKKEYLVLTDTHLVRFKSLQKAAETYPTIPLALGRSSTLRHSSAASIHSFSELHTTYSESSDDRTTGIPLKQIIAVNTLDDGRPYFAIEVASLDDETNHAPVLSIQLSTPQDRELWLDRIRRAADNARQSDPLPISVWNTHHAARLVEQQQDYDPQNCAFFKVVKRSSNILGDRSSSDDLTKVDSAVCILSVGIHKVHIMPLVKFPHRGSNTSLNSKSGVTSHGIMSITALRLGDSGDTCEITFRTPLKKARTFYLSSLAARDIILAIRLKEEYLRPDWHSRPYTFSVQSHALDDSDDVSPARPVDEDCFTRTLVAYCIAYDRNPSNIRYRITEPGEDPPCFDLLPPLKRKYDVYELLAIMRSLRYNETFHSISFSGIPLDELNGLRDPHGQDHLCSKTKKGVAMEVSIEDQKAASLLVQEIRALAITSKKLWHMDFTSCINRIPSSTFDGNKRRDLGCGILEALSPICKSQTTNVDWIVLNNIKLGETDMDHLVDAAMDRKCHFRSIELSNCQLGEQSLDLILDTLGHQSATLEVIDISNNPARISPFNLEPKLRRFDLLRKLNLSKLARTSDPEPLISLETLLSWRLQELSLSNTMINKETLEAISGYLHSPQSSILRELRLDRTNISGRDIGLLMHSMIRTPGEERLMHMDISENYIEAGYRRFIEAIAGGFTPSHLTLKSLDYDQEKHFHQLVVALTGNTTLRSLDISKASLPEDASPTTCRDLKMLFACNNTLEFLNISGEESRLEVSKIGVGINSALAGLESNRTLRVLHVQRQKLGIQGARTLSEVLKANNSLLELHCEENGIPLTGFTDLVNALQQNTTLIHLPDMAESRNHQIRQTKASVNNHNSDDENLSMAATKSSSMRRITSRVTGKTRPARSPSQLSEQDINAALRLVDDAWEDQVFRLHQYLERNINLGRGLPMEGEIEAAHNERPNTATDMARLLEKVRIDRTPTMEKDLENFGMGYDGTFDGHDSGNARSNQAEIHSSPSNSQPSSSSRNTNLKVPGLKQRRGSDATIKPSRPNSLAHIDSLRFRSSSLHSPATLHSQGIVLYPTRTELHLALERLDMSPAELCRVCDHVEASFQEIWIFMGY